MKEYTGGAKFRHGARSVNVCQTMTDWTSNIIRDHKGVSDMIRNTKTIAVLGIKPEFKGDQPAFFVPAYMADHGYEVIPEDSIRPCG